MNNHHLLGFTLSLLLAAPVAAQTVYRCGNDYRQVPCDGGRAIETPDAATSQQRLDAERLAEAERRRGDDMARDRRQQEASRRPSAAASLGPRKATAAAEQASASIRPTKNARGKIRVVEAEDFVARDPKAKPKPKKEKSDAR